MNPQRVSADASVVLRAHVHMDGSVYYYTPEGSMPFGGLWKTLSFVSGFMVVEDTLGEFYTIDMETLRYRVDEAEGVVRDGTWECTTHNDLDAAVMAAVLTMSGRPNFRKNWPYGPTGPTGPRPQGSPTLGITGPIRRGGTP